MDSVKTVTYQCPNCNAALEFDNASGRFRCLYCDGTFSEDEIKQIFLKRDSSVNLDENEPELNADQLEQEEFTGQSALYTCPNCGAGVICDSLTASTRCHFCHTPVILSGRLSGDFKPDIIIPFATTRNKAEENFKKYTRGKFLLPKGFRENAKINEISALYVPYWLKSGLVQGDMTAQAKTVTSWTVGDTTYTRTKIYHVERGAEMLFLRVPCDGSRRISDSLMESIEPFDYKGIKPFNMSYLSGCAAEKYDVPKSDAAIRIDERIQQAMEQELRKMAINYNSLENVQCRVHNNQQQYIYALLPVWFLNYTHNGKDYPFVMNGQTGTMFGELPISKPKAFFFTAGIALACLIVLLLLGGVFFGG